MIELFEDAEAGAFFSSTAEDASLMFRVKDDYDGAEPSGNSIAILNLLRLAHVTGREEWRNKAERALRALGAKMASGPTSVPQMLVAAMFAATAPKQIVLAGARDTLATLREVFGSRYLPFHSLVWSGSHALNPELKNMGEIDGRPTAYVCENFTCQLPVNEAAKLADLLQ